MTRTNTTLRLASYSVFALSYLSQTADVQGQIVYVDIDPDVSLPISLGAYSHNEYEMETTADDATWFFFTNRAYNEYWSTDPGDNTATIAWNYFQVAPPGFGGVMGVTGPYGHELLSVLHYGDMISAAGNWTNGTSGSSYKSFFYYERKIFNGGTTTETFGYGNWVDGESDSYIGMRFKMAGYYHYGWIRLDVSTGERIPTLSGFAYELTADKSIQAGVTQTQHTSTDAQIPDNFIINCFENQITIQIQPTLLTSYRIEIYNVDGHMIFSENEAVAEKIISTDGYSTGVYFVKIKVGKEFFMQKIFISG